MLRLNRHLAARFMGSHPGTVVLVEGGGTGVGAQAMIEGRADLCAASRNLSADEIEALFAATGTLGARTMVALDAIAVYVHPENPVRDLTVRQVASIFNGTTTNWMSIGGPRSAILPIIRPPTSGTYRFIKDHVLAGNPYAEHSVTVQRNQDVIAEVSSKPQAIGYGGWAYSGDVLQLAVSGVLPDETTIRDGSYPLARYLYLIATQPPTGLAGVFVDWVTGAEGQSAVSEVGLIPLWSPP
jgi:phosphate transport system substrate-binding protein